MAALTVRNLNEDTKQGLRLRAALRGASMEDEVRSILRAVVDSGLSLEDLSKDRANPTINAWDAVKTLREKYGTFEFEIPERTDDAGDPAIFREE